MENTYVVIKDMIAGNEEVGTSWQETKIFKGTDTLDDVMKWAIQDLDDHSRKRITITKPHGD